MHESVGNRRVGEDIVKVRDERPVAMILHHVLRTVDHLVVVLLLFPQSVLAEHVGHHVLERGYHDVEQVKIIRHPESQLLVAEELDRDVDDAIGEGIRVVSLNQHQRHSGIMKDECTGEGLLVLGVWQHIEQEADQFLRELVLDRPKDEFL